MNIPDLPFNLRFEHNGSKVDALCTSLQPADDISPGAWRFLLQTRRVFGMLPNEEIWLISEQGARCKATLVDFAESMTGCNSVQFIANIPDDWFAS